MYLVKLDIVSVLAPPSLRGSLWTLLEDRSPYREQRYRISSSGTLIVIGTPRKVTLVVWLLSSFAKILWSLNRWGTVGFRAVVRSVSALIRNSLVLYLPVKKSASITASSGIFLRDLPQ